MNKEFSIIIPHHKAINKLKRLLNTIPLENTEVEVIVVDDKSLDDKELKSLKEEFKEVVFLKNISQNKGAGASRNIGLKKSRGKWILFADSDDYFEKGFFNVIQNLKNSNADIIYFKPISFYDDTKEIANRHTVYEDLIDEYKNNQKIDIKYKFHVPWSKMLKGSFLRDNNIEFEEIISGNDILFSVKAGYLSKKIETSEEIIYCVTRNKGSLTMNKSLEIFDSRFNALVRYNNFLIKRKLSEYQKPMLAQLKKSKKYGYKYFIKSINTVLKNNQKIIPDSYFLYFKSPKKIFDRIMRIKEIAELRKTDKKYHVK